MGVVGTRRSWTSRTVGVTVVVSVAATVLLGVASPAHAAAVIDVPASQPTIQAAIDAASNGDTVVVAPGTYYENIDFKGKAIEVRSSAGAGTTTIDGGGSSVVVLFTSGEGRTSVLRGFTVTHGVTDTSTGTLLGAGIGILDSSPTITENVVTENNVPVNGAGAGIGAYRGAPLIAANHIHHNHGGDRSAGGGVVVENGAAEVEGNVIENNGAGGAGGVMAFGGTPVLRANVIRGNTVGAFNAGGVDIWNTAAGALFVDNVISDNVSQSSGGGVYIEGTGTAYLLNNTIANNQAVSAPGVDIAGGAVTMTNTIVTGPSGPPPVRCTPNLVAAPVFSHDDVYNGGASPYDGCTSPTGTSGNSSVDPLVAAPGYRPQPGSPVIDAGDNAAPSLPAVDNAGAPRVSDGNGDGVAVVDIGAVETAAVAVTGDRYHPLTPARILDTRIGLGAPAARLGPASTLALQVTGRGGVPTTGVSAVVLNVTVTEPTGESFLTAWPAGAARPTASNLNFLADQTVPNLVVAKVGDGGKVNLYNNAGATHVVADVAGWYGGRTAGSRYTGVTPARLLDTRNGVGAPGAAKLGPASTLALQVTGRGGVPMAGVSAVVLNITATQPTTESFVTAWPAGIARPTASNLNVVAGQTAPNLVVVTVGVGGKISLYNNAGFVDLVADVAGWFGADGASGGAGFSSVTPARILDTRSGIGAPVGKLGPASTLPLQVTGRGGVPASGVKSIVLNVTATQPSAVSFLTAWPAGVARPLASNLNVAAGQTVSNLVMVDVGEGGEVNLFNNAGSTDVVVDVAGWYSG